MKLNMGQLLVSAVWITLKVAVYRVVIGQFLCTRTILAALNSTSVNIQETFPMSSSGDEFQRLNALTPRSGN